MARTFSLISSSTSSGLVTFSSLPSTYDHLVIFAPAASTNKIVYVNSTGTSNFNYSGWRVVGASSTWSAQSGSSAAAWNPQLNYTVDPSNSSYCGFRLIFIYNYRSASLLKGSQMITGISNTTNASQTLGIQGGIYNSTSAITSVSLYNDFDSTTPIFLYGIKDF